MLLQLHTAATRFFSRFTYKSLIFSIILFGCLAMINGCKSSDDPTPVRPDLKEPVITSFTPTSGLAGTTEVVITGENFSATAGDITVKIGNVAATVKASTTTSITVTVPAGAITGKISVTVKGATVTSANDFTVITSPKDFFTLTVDASYQTSEIDAWVLASSKSGDWIDVQPYEGGQTITLNGVVTDVNTFTLHFLTISKQSGNNYCTMKSITDVPVNGTWLLKTMSSTAPDLKLTVNVNNYTLPTDWFKIFQGPTVTANVGTSGYGMTGSGSSLSMDVSVLKSPADVLVTLYENGLPRYAKYKSVTVPSTITLDASTAAVAADRTFTMSLPTNNYFYVAIDAFDKDQKYGYSMFRYMNSDGGPGVSLGYQQGYQKYRTMISYRDGKKIADLTTFKDAVEETHTFPAFDFTFNGLNVTDFKAVSDLPFAAATVDFQYNQPGMVLLWNVVEPGSGSSREITFKAKPFPAEIMTAHPFLPALGTTQIPAGGVSAFQFFDGKTYNNFVDAASKSESVVVNFLSDNYFRFGKTVN
ncbi:MAG: IPT/TIG domain-containing protein [Chryseolinea sp.]